MYRADDQLVNIATNWHEDHRFALAFKLEKTGLIWYHTGKAAILEEGSMYAFRNV